MQCAHVHILPHIHSQPKQHKHTYTHTLYLSSLSYTQHSQTQALQQEHTQTHTHTKERERNWSSLFCRMCWNSMRVDGSHLTSTMSTTYSTKLSIEGLSSCWPQTNSLKDQFIMYTVLCIINKRSILRGFKYWHLKIKSKDNFFFPII